MSDNLWQRKRCYITTPIYYANGTPHIGNAYTSFLADLLARLKRLAGYEVKFATGTDENGQKMMRTAADAGKSLDDFLHDIADIHKSMWHHLQISYTDFIRTTSPLHTDFVQDVVRKTFAAEYMYRWAYKGFYCVGCEAFKKETDLTPEGTCPDHLTKPEIIEEENRFFALSRMQDFLQTWYTAHPDFCLPHKRYNEVRAFVEQGLEDFSVSRQWSPVGIPFPADVDPDAVVYIWFDALYNYMTVCQDSRNQEMIRQRDAGKTEHMTPAERALDREGERRSGDVQKIHVLWKDIARFHAIYRPAMLHAIWEEQPDHLIINGFFTVDGQKMSKSLGNSLHPWALIEEYGRDALVYYLFSDIKVWSDGDFSTQRLADTKENVLKKTRWNLVSRTIALALKNNVNEFAYTSTHAWWWEKQLDAISSNTLGQLLRSWSLDRHDHIQQTIDTYTDKVDLHRYIQDWYELVQVTNKFVDDTKPRETAKTDLPNAQAAIASTLWMIKNLALLGSPFLLESTRILQDLFLREDKDRRQRSTDTSDMTAPLPQLLSATSGACTLQKGHLF